MSFKEKIMEGAVQKAAEKMATSMRVLEDNMITVQKNQCEYEAYIKDIIERLKRIEANQNRKKE